MTPEQKANNIAKCCKEINKKILGHGKVYDSRKWRAKKAEMVKKICSKHNENPKLITKLMRI